ncbi:MAG: 23S rRNA (adenine(2503)-C(2))-methyltransferase RlmN [Actinomycetota bacterium]|nr:23S rRNA (adenine(2503)-C(2))-methyltransferase RlmN [Actinomycetota bacterium]
MPGTFDLTPQDLSGILSGEPAYRTRQVWRSLHLGRQPEEMTDLPVALRSRLAETLVPGLHPEARWVNAEGDTTKWLWALADGARVETVLMAYRSGRVTVCVSTQAGCAMACSFCATGQAGFQRQLTVGEIVEQVVRARAAWGGGAGSPAASGGQPQWRTESRRPKDPGARRTNIVFMGMGEPLANYANTWGAVERLHGDLGISARHLTVSTVGVVPGILRLADERLPVNLAVSLHGANDELRDSLVPINRRYPISAVIEACQAWVSAKNRRLSFEWALIDGVNDRPSDAMELAALARPLAAHVNLIPLNPTPGYLTRATPAAGVRAFRGRLVAAGVNATIRRNRGTDIAAACGQLAAAGQPPSA